MATARLRTEDRRAQITDAALRLVATRGIAALSTGEIARAVGVTSGALFRHFPSLDAVLEAMADRVAELLASSHPPADLAPLERLARFFDARSALARAHPGIPRLVLSEQFAHALPARARRVLRDAVRRSFSFVRQAIADGQREGTVRDDVPPDALSPIVMGTLQMTVLKGPLRAGEEAGAEVIRDGLLALLASPAKGASPRRRR